MSLSRRIPGLSNAPKEGSSAQSQWMDQVTTALRSGLGQSKTQDDKWLTWADLETSEVVVKSTKPGGGYQPSNPPTTPPDKTPPPILEGVEASGGMTAIYIRWDDPDLDYYYHIEIHRANTDELANAVMVGTTIGNIFQDVVGSDTTTKYYWCRTVKQSGGEHIIGAWNSTQGTPANAASDPDWILSDLEGKINDSHLNDLLSGEIDKIPRIDRDVSDIEDSVKDIEKGVDEIEDSIKNIDLDISNLQTGLNTETEERQTEDESLSKRISTNVSRIGDNAAAIVVESETRATDDEALAAQITTLKAEVGDNSAAIQTESEVRASEDEALASRITTIQVEVDGNKAAIQTESEVRASEDEVLAKRIDTQTARIDDNAAAIQTESEVRASEDEALAKQITTLAAEVGDNTGAIQTESEVRASEDEVLAKRITTMQAEVDGNKAAIQTESEVRASEDEVLAKRIDTQVVRIDDNAAAIQSESTVRATEDEALAKSITLLTAEVGDNRAAIQTESETRASEDSALASQITQLEAEVDGKFAGIRDEMQVIISDAEKLASRVGTVELDLDETKGAIEQKFKVFEDEFESIRAEYTVKLDVDGYVGGFGLVNDGDVITALWRVDVFGVGAPGSEKLTFAIDAEENRVVMDGAYIKNASITDAQIGNLNVDKLIGGTAEFVQANIRDASITNAKIGNVIQSNNYEASRAGWIINKAGFAEFSDVIARGLVEGSVIRGSVIEGGLLIQSDIQITTPTEADKGAGTIRYLSVVTNREHVASFDGNQPQSAETKLLKLVTADYTAEGSDFYGDGEVQEEVYVNFDRYLKYSVNPEISFHVTKELVDKRYSLSYRLLIKAVNYNNTKEDIYETSNTTVSGGSTEGWFHGTNSDGDWSVYIDVQPIRDGDSGSIIGYKRGLIEAMVTINKRSFNYRDRDYKSMTATIKLNHGSSQIDPFIRNITLKDTLSRYA